MNRIALLTLLTLPLCPCLAAAQVETPTGAEATDTPLDGAARKDAALQDAVDDDSEYCTLRPYFRASIGGGPGIFMTSDRRSSSGWRGVAIEGLGRLDLVLGHDMAADPGVRIQIQYRATGFGNQAYMAHRHAIELTMALGNVFAFRGGGGVSVRHPYQGGTVLSGVMTVGIDLTFDAFLMSFDLATFDFLPGVIEWTPSLSFGFQIR